MPSAMRWRPAASITTTISKSSRRRFVLWSRGAPAVQVAPWPQCLGVLGQLRGNSLCVHRKRLCFAFRAESCGITLRWQQQAGIDDFSRQPAPVATAGLLGGEPAARRLQLPSAATLDNGELHALRGRTVSRSADHRADPALPGIRSFAPASRRRSRHANTESGFRASSRFGAQSHPAHPFFRNPYSPPETMCSCPWTGSSEGPEHTGK